MVVLPTKLDLLPGVQQATNCTLTETLITFFRSVLCVWRFSTKTPTLVGPSAALFIHRNSKLVTSQVQPTHYAWLVVSI